VKGLFQTGHHIPLPVLVAKNGYIPVMFSLATGLESLLHSQGNRDARWIISTGAPLQFLLHEVPRSVASPLGGDANPLQVTPSNCQVALTNWPVPLHSWVGKGTARVKCHA